MLLAIKWHGNSPVVLIHTKTRKLNVTVFPPDDITFKIRTVFPRVKFPNGDLFWLFKAGHRYGSLSSTFFVLFFYWLNYRLYTVLTILILVFCVMTPCCLVGNLQSFWEFSCFYLHQHWRWRQQTVSNPTNISHLYSLSPPILLSTYVLNQKVMSKYSLMTQVIWTFVNYSPYVLSQPRNVIINHLDNLQFKILHG